MDVPEFAYALNGDVHIAYQVVGEGPPDIVFIWGPFSNLDLVWEHPPARRFIDRLASIGRVIMFDKRGTGLSDRAVPLPTLEEQMDDVLAVLKLIWTTKAETASRVRGRIEKVLDAAKAKGYRDSENPARATVKAGARPSSRHGL